MVIWDFIKKKISSDQKVFLMVVIESTGSSPGRCGFKMAVSEDGKMTGSIGGGIMEFNLVEYAKKQFSKTNDIFIKRQIHDSKDKSESSGMICAGSQIVAFYPLDRKYLTLIETISKAENGKLVFSESGILFNRELKSSQEFISVITDDNKWSFTEQLGFKNFLYVFGAGHVSVAVSKLFAELDFHVTVFDNRDKHLTTFKSNTYAHEKKIIEYKKVSKHIPEGDNIYVVIMTFAHKSDSKILKQLISKKVRYLGMMGSDKKVASIYEKLESKGVLVEDLQKVDAPIGLQINSRTPMEIAVSIAGKIIKVKNS